MRRKHKETGAVGRSSSIAVGVETGETSRLSPDLSEPGPCKGMEGKRKKPRTGARGLSDLLRPLRGRFVEREAESEYTPAIEPGEKP